MFVLAVFKRNLPWFQSLFCVFSLAKLDNRTKIKIEAVPESDSDFYSNTKPTMLSKTTSVEKMLAEDKSKMNRYFRKELQFEHDIRHPAAEEDDEDWTGIDLFDPTFNKATLLCTGPNYQADIPTLNLHKKSRIDSLGGWFIHIVARN